MLGGHARSRHQSGPVPPSFNWADSKMARRNLKEICAGQRDGTRQTVQHSNIKHKATHVTGKEANFHTADLSPVCTGVARGHRRPHRQPEGPLCSIYNR